MMLFDYLIFPGFLFSAAIGLLATWVDRKVTARLQYRVGPPWFQPFADIAKLLGKETIVPEGAVKYVFLGAPLVGLAAATLIAAILFRGQPFVGDLIVVFYLLTLPSLALIVGGSASRNPLAALGASREMKLILAYELPFILVLVTVILKARSIMIGDIVAHQALAGMMVFSASGLLAFIAALAVAQAKLGAVPFDIAEAEQELAAGPLLEYSGAPLALFRLTRALLYLVLPAFLIVLFLGGLDAWAPLKYLLVLTVIILVKNTNPRLRIDHALRFFWGPVTGLAALAFILALFGW
jgi:NADH-quinone oxidoreductase subunit H